MRYLLTTLLLIFFLLTKGEARRKKDALQEQTLNKEERTTIVQANHFFSEKQTSKVFNVTSLQKNKPFVFLLLNIDQTSTTQQLYNNPVSVTLTAGSASKECNFTIEHGLCSLPSIITQNASVKVSCQKAPCSLHWRIVQPETVEIDGEHSLNHLVSVNQEKNHAILKLFCTNPEIRLQLDSKIELFTNSGFNKVVNKEGEVSFLFNNEQKGQYFISTADKAIEQCTNARLYHTAEQIQLRKDGFSIQDFLSFGHQNIYEITKMPDTDIMLQVAAYDAEMKELSNDTSLSINLVGIKQNKTTNIRGLSLSIDDEKDFIDFSMIFKKPTEKYDKLEVHLKGTNKNFLIMQMSFVSDDVHKVQLSEQSYFYLKKGEKINYKMVPIDKQVKNIETVNILLSNHQSFNISKESCPKEGCQFTIQALTDDHGFIYVGQDIKDKKSKEIIEQQFDKSIGSKLREGEQKYYIYKLKANDAIQILINTPNVIVYAANRQKCSAQNLTQCHQKQISYHNPSIYQAKQDITLAFKVVALDNSQFVLTIIDSKNPYIDIRDTQPFVYLMDGSEHQLYLHFKIRQKEDVSFNLIAPLNQLNLIVYNKQKLDKEDSNYQSQEAQFSSEGYVSYSKSQLKTTSFVIKIQKRQQYKQKFVHFTMIASTKQANLRLEAGNPHYDTLKPKVTRDLVFQFLPKKKIFLNFYTHNINKDINISLKINNADEYTNTSNMVNFTINKPTDVLNVGIVSQTLCKSLETECQLFVRLQNLMSVEIDITVTLIMENSVIELKDGIWQNYDINKAASSTHFYFLPKHQKHSIAIFYHSSLVDVKIVYRLWKSEDTSLDISEWPFPLQFDQVANKPSPLQFKPVQFIHIEPNQLSQCWPNCVVLLSIMSDEKQIQKLQAQQSPVFMQSHQFRIMASNNLVEIPQKQKIDFVLDNGEEKNLLVDLKYFIEKQSLVFFTYLTMGSVSLKANVYSQRNPRCPTSEQITADYTFQGIETEIEMQDLKKKIQENSMEKDKSPYLCILAHAFSESKIAIEFASEISDIKNLQIDTNTPVKLKSSQTRTFQINAHFDFYIKISRQSGFPFVATKLCNPVKEKHMELCLDDFKNSEEKGNQMVNKIMSYSETPCISCMFYIKITAKQESQLTIHAQSKYVQIQLKENSPLTDILTPNQINKYQIMGVTGKQVIINIQILSGDLNVGVMDFQFVSINKKNPKGNTNIHIIIPTKDLADKRRTNPAFATSFGLSNFNNYHVTIQSQDPKQPASYIITYSNGQSNIYLQDGLLSQYSISPKKISKFYYNNPSSSGIYLYLSTTEAQTLNSLKLKVYTTEQKDDQDTKTEIKTEKSQFSKKTINPTLLLHLPFHSQYIIQIENSINKDIVFFIGINDKQIIYLPYDHQFPFRLENNSYLYFVLPTTSTAGYVRFTLNKCNSNQPYVAYTDDYDNFVSQTFDTQEQITDTLIYQNVIKVKTGKSLYFKVRAEQLAVSIVTVKATFSSTKLQINRAKAGNKGNIEYQLLESKKAEISYSGVVCQKNCGQFTYSAISSDHFESIIAQLVCPSVSFDLLGFSQTNHPQTISVKPTKTSDNKLTFNLTLSNDNQFIGIKALNSKSGATVYYQPIQIANLAGKLNNVIAVASNQKNLPWIFVVLSLCLICVPLIAYRRYKKKREYSSLNNDDMNDSMN